MRYAHAGRLAGFALAILVLAGCDSDVAYVKGTVSYAGAPIEDGAITFVPVDGTSPTAGGLIKNGQYSAKCSVGAMKVVITGTKIVGMKKFYPNSPEKPVKGQFLPEKYADHAKTELTLQVKPGMNQKDWALEE